MILRLMVVAVTAMVALCPIAVFADGMTPDQLLDMSLVSSYDLSHSGKMVTYTVSIPATVGEEGGYKTPLFLRDLDADKAVPFISGDVHIGSPKFSADDKYIAFTMSRGEKAKTQVWVIPVNGGEAQVVTDSKTGISSYAWSADGNSVFYTANESVSETEKKVKDEGYMPRYYEENLKSKNLYRTAFEFAAEPAEVDTLVTGMAIWQIAVDPAGKLLAFGASKKALIDQKYMFQDIFLLDLETGEFSEFANPPGKLGSFEFSPKGDKLAWTAARSKDDHAVSNGYVRTLPASRIKSLTDNSFEGHIRAVHWADNNKLMILADEGINTTISVMNWDSSKMKQLLTTEICGLDFISFTGHPGMKTRILRASSPAHQRELFKWNGKKLERLTDSNPWLADVDLADQKVIRYNALDGLMIEGLMIFPLGWKAGDAPFPLIMDVHGGPESNVSNGWLSWYSSPGQVAATQGYGTFFPNYRGSTGRGYEFAVSSFADPAGGEFEDVADGINHLVEIGYADADRVAVTGGSYGGYASAWFGTHPDFTKYVKATIPFVGVSDLVAKRFLTDIPYEDEIVHMGQPVRKMRDLMHERSPITWAEYSKSAILILHGENDTRVHPSQSQELYRALKMSGHTATRLIYYPGEGHGNRKHPGRIDLLMRSMDWLNWYVRDLKPLDGPMPPLDISEKYGLDLD
jgi:dipeptidyl aminopeptidase/acylaminoacyl peptidase